jgi:hypothetical protein
MLKDKQIFPEPRILREELSQEEGGFFNKNNSGFGRKVVGAVSRPTEKTDYLRY